MEGQRQERGRGGKREREDRGRGPHTEPQQAQNNNNNNNNRNGDRPRGGRGGRGGGRGGRGGGRGGNAHVDPMANESQQVQQSQQQRPPRGGQQQQAAAAAAADAKPSFEVIGGDASITFDALKIIPSILRAVADMGYKTPTPIQQRAVPHVLAGRDVLAGARTGTGKTAAFAMPVLQLMNAAPPTSGTGHIRTLVLTPTRELAAQVHENFVGLSKYVFQRPADMSTVVVGGVGMGSQITALGRRPVILVATPGRLLDLHGEKHANLGHVEFAILDEADRMLDMGFYPDVSKILALLPRQRQTLLFSATFSPEIRQMAATILRPGFAEVQVTPPNSTVELIDQYHYIVGRDAKKDALVHIIQSQKLSQVLVFTRTKQGANKVAEMLNKQRISALALHGGKSQTARTASLSQFKTGELRVLVATDIAARGLDIEELPNVINYELPNITEDYVHRIGRTGRAGRKGTAISLVCRDEEGFLRNIINFAKTAKIPQRNDLPPQFAPPPNEVAEPIALGRMTLWGGAGPLPPKSVMDAAGKAARREIADNIRAKKEKEWAAKAEKDRARQQPAGGHQPHRRQQQFAETKAAHPQHTKPKPQEHRAAQQPGTHAHHEPSATHHAPRHDNRAPRGGRQ